jgi:outer membrane receptor for ferrienterochelin and colicin
VNGSVSITGQKNGTANSVNGGTPLWFQKMRSGEWSNTTNPAQFTSERTAVSSTQTSSINVNHQITSQWQQHFTAGRSQTSFSIVPEAPRFGTLVDTMYRRQQMSGSRSSFNYDMSVVPSRLGALSSTLTIGANGSWGTQSASSGCTVTRTSFAFVDCAVGNVQQVVAVTQTMDSKSWGGFSSLQLGLFDKLYLTLGLRGEQNPNYGRNHKIDWTPTNGLAYTMERGDLTVKVLGSYGQATRPPSPDMRLSSEETWIGYDPTRILVQFESPDLRPEYSRGPQGGVEIYDGSLGSFTVNRYRQTVSDLIQRVYVDSITVKSVSTGSTLNVRQGQYLNAATIRQQGWEMTSAINVGPLALKGTYSLMDSRILSLRPSSSETGYYRGMRFLNLPSHTGNITATYAMGGTSVTVVTNYVGSANRSSSDYSTAFSQLRLMVYTPRATGFQSQMVNPGYVKSDVTASHRLSSALSATFNVTNLGNNFGNDYRNMWPTLGRQTALGLSLRYPSKRR